jgi:hypothetical protein
MQELFDKGRALHVMQAGCVHAWTAWATQRNYRGELMRVSRCTICRKRRSKFVRASEV